MSPRRETAVGTSGHFSGGRRAIKICPKDKTEYGDDDISFCPLCGTRLVSVGLRKGEVIGGSYRIVNVLGRGWAGTVYRAEHSMMGRPTALKVISSPVVSDPAFIERFRMAAALLSELDVPEVAIVHDLGIEPPNRIFVASELVDGKSLAKALSEEGPLAAQRFLDIVRVVLAGLKRAHEMGMVHGSVKPANIILSSEDNAPKLVDFGIRRIVESLQDELFAVKTSQGLIYGDLAYMAPEQITGDQVDRRTDVYLLGVTMYELLTGARPFRQEDPDELVQAQLDDKPVPMREFKPQLKIPKFIEKAVMRALEKKPRRRQQSAGELIEQIQAEIVPETEEPKSVWQRAKEVMAGAKPPVEEPISATHILEGLLPEPSAPASADLTTRVEDEAKDSDGPRFVLYEGKTIKSVFPVTKTETLVGRSPECDIVVDDQTISRVHARVSSKPDRIVVEDLNSLNGTYINNDAIKRGHIEDKDIVAFGNVSLVFRTT